MAFNQQNMAMSSTGLYDSEAPQGWKYKSADSLATMKGSGYFDNARPLPNIGDVIYLYDTNLAQSDLVRVTAVSPNVTVAEAISLTAGEIPLTNGNILVGQPTGIAGDVSASTLSQVFDADQATNVATAATTGGLPIIFAVDTAGGATASVDVVMDHKVQVLDVWVRNDAAGTASDTIQVTNGTGSNHITDAIDISGLDTTIARAGALNNNNDVINASGTLRVTETDGGGSDSPATRVYILAMRVA